MTDSPNLENEAGNFKVDLQAIRQRAEAATPGPWRWGWRNDNDVPGSIVAGHPHRPEAVVMCPRYGKDTFPHDAEFIAHARTDIPHLLALVGRLEQRIQELEDERAHVWGPDDEIDVSELEGAYTVADVLERNSGSVPGTTEGQSDG